MSIGFRLLDTLINEIALYHFELNLNKTVDLYVNNVYTDTISNLGEIKSQEQLHNVASMLVIAWGLRKAS